MAEKTNVTGDHEPGKTVIFLDIIIPLSLQLSSIDRFNVFSRFHYLQPIEVKDDDIFGVDFLGFHGPAAKLRPQLALGDPESPPEKEPVQDILAHRLWLSFFIDRFEHEAERLDVWAMSVPLPGSKEIITPWKPKINPEKWIEHARTVFDVDPWIAFSLGARFPTNSPLKMELTHLVQVGCGVTAGWCICLSVTTMGFIHVYKTTYYLLDPLQKDLDAFTATIVVSIALSFIPASLVVAIMKSRLRAMVARDEFGRRRNKATIIVQVDLE
ncbi:unnamed protein product [Lactuca saligna]|uniref:PI4-kinase N-terminal domain-containing protein n=1 Tax=Lactuca saligna TaxID=75948 RepID=A0AA36EJR5_LACSI|nr:unnamed protein product [Lactuca saligna]